MPSETGDEGAIPPESNAPSGAPAGHPVNQPGPKPTPHSGSDEKTTTEEKDAGESSPDAGANPTASEKRKDKDKRGTSGAEPFERWERDEMEKLLGQLNGHLGSYNFFLWS